MWYVFNWKTAEFCRGMTDTPSRIVKDVNEVTIFVSPAMHETYAEQRETLSEEMERARHAYYSPELRKLEADLALYRAGDAKAKEVAEEWHRKGVAAPKHDYSKSASAKIALDRYRLLWADGIAAVAVKIAILDEKMRDHLRSRFEDEYKKYWTT